jgi:hypothetical protein
VSARVFEPQIWQYQFVQSDAKTLILKVVPTSRFDQSTAEELRSKVAALLGEEMTVVVETVDQIPAETSGKRLVVKSALQPRSAVAAP